MATLASTTMNKLMSYVTTWWKSFDAGELAGHPDPEEPTDLDTPLTQDDINFVKRLKKEMEERFTPPPET